jgi:cysteine desulfurase
MALDLAGIAVSAGSACSSGKVERSPVLAAMGAGILAGEALRVSLGWHTDAADIDAFLDVYGALLNTHRALGERAYGT